MGFQKKLPKTIAYCYYKKLDNFKFHDDFNNFVFDQFDLGNFMETISNIFDKMIQSNKNIFEQMKSLL